VISEALKFATTGLQIYQNRAAEKTRARDLQESLDSESRRREEDRQVAREQYIQGRRDKAADRRRDVEDQERLIFTTAELQNYPVRSGPGQLRGDIELLGREELPLVVLFVPSHEDDDADARGLPRLLQAALTDLLVTHELEFMTVVADRWMSWPHAALVRHDLRDVPTIVVSAALINKNLVLRLGGCNLGGDDDIRPFRQLLYAPLPSSVFWTEARLAALESTSRNGFQRPSAGTADFERLLQLEWAARTSLVGIVAAIDAYFLLRRRGYREHLDDAAALVSPEVALAGPPSREGALADPAYHLMHRARRQLAVGADDEATASVCEALRILAGDGNCPPDEAVITALSTGRLESWHRAMLEELDVLAPEGAVVPAHVMVALRRPAPVVDPDEAPSADPAARAHAAPQPDVPSNGPWPRRAVTETRPRATVSRGSPRGRQVTETWVGAAYPRPDER
jgi:hypothetical protein